MQAVCRAVQIRERGLSAIHQVCGQADDKGDAPPCDRLPALYINRGVALPHFILRRQMAVLVMASTIRIVQQGRDMEHGLGRLHVGGLKAEVEDLKAQMHEFPAQVRRGGTPSRGATPAAARSMVRGSR